MPTKLNESLTGNGAELIFPDEATGKQYKLRELAVYEAEEVRDQLGGSDVPKYGKWLPVELRDDDEAWLCAPSSLRERLVDEDVTEADTFTVTSLDKTGHEQSAPYRAEIDVEESRPDDGKVT